MFLLNEGRHVLPIPTQTLQPQQLDDIMTTVSRMKRSDPMVTFVQHCRAASRAFQMEANPALAVLEAHISSEVLFNSVLQMMAWEAGVEPERAAEWFDEPLSKRLRTRYAPFVGGDWNTFGGGAIGEWARYVRDLRDKIAHRGYWPSAQEAWRALQTMDAVEAFVKSRLIERRNDHPRTTLLVAGTPGIRKAGKYTGKIKSFVETVADVEPDWLQSYGIWMDKFWGARAKSKVL